MPEHQDLVTLCHMLPAELLENVREKVYVAKLQDRLDIGWGPVLKEIRQRQAWWKFGWGPLILETRPTQKKGL